MRKTKLLLTFLILIFTIQIGTSQELTQKYNSLLKRTEFFNSYGNMVAYAKENTLLK